jgi:DNA helicase-4
MGPIRSARFLKTLYHLATPDLEAGKSIGVLFRTNVRDGEQIVKLKNKFLTILRQMGFSEKVKLWEEEKITFSTVHKFKGAERDTIFIVDPHVGSFPLINADKIELFRFFGESLEQSHMDERRLFYVAITRARERLVFLTETQWDNESPYLDNFAELIDIVEVPRDLKLRSKPTVIRNKHLGIAQSKRTIRSLDELF